MEIFVKLYMSFQLIIAGIFLYCFIESVVNYSRNIRGVPGSIRFLTLSSFIYCIISIIPFGSELTESSFDLFTITSTLIYTLNTLFYFITILSFVEKQKKLKYAVILTCLPVILYSLFCLVYLGIFGENLAYTVSKTMSQSVVKSAYGWNFLPTKPTLYLNLTASLSIFFVSLYLVLGKNKVFFDTYLKIGLALNVIILINDILTSSMDSPYLVYLGFSVYLLEIIRINYLLSKQNILQILKLERENKEIQNSKLESLSYLISGVAHEMNTPIGNAQLDASSLEEKTDLVKASLKNRSLTEKELKSFLDKSQDYLESIRKNLFRSSKVITNFRFISDQSDLESPVEIDVESEVRAIFKEFGSKLTENKIETEFSFVPIKIHSYRNTLYHVISNILSNCINHAFKDAKAPMITVHTHEIDKWCIIDIEDNGKGISPENIVRVFDPYFSTSKNDGGSGYGLSLAYYVTKNKLNGELTCDSEVDKYTKFSIKLPL